MYDNTINFMVVSLLSALFLAILGTASLHFLTSRQRTNKFYRLPPNWSPEKHFGPGVDPHRCVLTPHGIRVYPNGFDSPTIPEYHPDYPEIRVRVDLELIDRIWDEVRNSISSVIRGLSYSDVINVKNLPDDYPIVMFEPTVWYDVFRYGYIRSEVLWGRKARVCIYYKSRIDGTIYSWPTLLKEEFVNIALSAVGKRM